MIYVAGPMIGVPHFNFPKFDLARDFLKALNYEVVSPADIDRAHGFDAMRLPGDTDWSDFSVTGLNKLEVISRDIEALKQCQAIYMLTGWEKSVGAQAEHALAKWMGLEIFSEEVAADEDVLEEALRITSGDRMAQYGPADQDFLRTAGLWNALFASKLQPDELFETWDIAQAMILLKLSRLQHSPKRDSIVDIAGYARCMGICYDCDGGYENDR